MHKSLTLASPLRVLYCQVKMHTQTKVICQNSFCSRQPNLACVSLNEHISTDFGVVVCPLIGSSRILGF